MSVDLIFRPPEAVALDHRTDDVRVIDAPAPPLPPLVDPDPDPVEALLLSVAHGDHDALVALQARMSGLVQLNVRRILRDATRTEAVTRTIFADLQADAARFDPAQGDAQTWLLTHAHQHATNQLPTPTGPRDPPDGVPTPGDEPCSREAQTRHPNAVPVPVITTGGTPSPINSMRTGAVPQPHI